MMIFQRDRRFIFGSAICLMLLVVVAASFYTRSAQASPAAAAQSAEKMEPGVREAILAAGEGSYLVFMAEQADLSLAYDIQDRTERGQYVYDALRETAVRSQIDIRQYLNRQINEGQAREYQSFFVVNALLVTSDVATLDALAARDDVAHIYANEMYEIPEPVRAEEDHSLLTLEWGIQQIQADQVWAGFGTTGAGIVVANIDTGVRYTHDALNAQYRGTTSGSHDFNWYDPANICGGGIPCDNHGHGSHTMGTIVGDDGGVNEIGVAPGAQWIAAKGCESTTCSSASLLNSAQWMLAPCPVGVAPGDPACDAAMRPHIVNNSWGGGGGDPWYQASVDAWDASGILHVFSAGNSGPGAGTIGSPSDYCNTLSIGATDSSDTIASFSSRGPGAFAGCTQKPNVSAPGVAVRSSLNGSDTSYGNFNGTSMAAPHVTGCIALLLSLDPTLTQTDVTNLLESTAVDLGPAGFDFDYGWGRIDCYAAASQLLPTFTLAATPDSASVCQSTPAIFDVAVGSISGFSAPVTLSNNGGGSHAPNPVPPPGNSTLTIPTGTYPVGTTDVLVTGQTVTITKQITVPVNVYDSTPGSVTLLTPADGATNVPTTPTFTWAPSAQADSYTIQIATDAGFSNIVDSATVGSPTYTAAVSLAPNTSHYWRVRAENPCGAGSFSAAFSFTTAAQLCRTPNLAIPDDPDISDSLTIPGNLGTITDLNLLLDVNHTYVGDLQFSLRHDDTGTQVMFIDRPGRTTSGFGCGGDNINATINDEGVDGNVESTCLGSVPTIQGDLVGGDPANNTLFTAFDGENLEGTWTLLVSDQAGGDTGTLNEWCIDVSLTPPPNTPPVASSDAYTGTEDVLLAVTAPGVLGNDTDGELDPLTAVLDSTTSSGSLTLNTDGSFSYVPDADFCGTDGFTYHAHDGTADSNVTAVTIYVTCANDAPVAVTDSYTGTEDVTLNVAAPGVLENDGDVDGDALTAVLDSTTSSGSLTLNGDGSFSYDPDADFCGVDSFTYHAHDGAADSSIASVTIDVACENDAPTANDDTYATLEDQPLSITTPGVLDNDGDVDGDLLTAVIQSGPANGVVTLNLDGSFVYTPTTNYYGQDSFTYMASDGNLSDTATVTIDVASVNDPPSVNAGGDQTADEGETVQFMGSYIDPGLMQSGRRLEGGELIHWDFGDGATATGTLTPTHSFGDNGIFSVTLTITDTEGLSASDTLVVTISNVAPAINAGPDQAVEAGAMVQFAGSAADPGWLDTHTITWDFGDGGMETGTFTPSHVYLSAGVYTATLTVTDDDGGTSTDTLVITVTEPPVTSFLIYLPFIMRD